MSTIANTKRTKKYKALIAIGLDETTALKQLGFDAAPTDDRKAKLIAAGFTEAEANAALGAAEPAATPPGSAPAPVEVVTPPTAKEIADQLVADAGLTFTKGRVYASGDIIEAAVRVRKTGRAEWIASSGVGRTKAVVLYKDETSGDVVIQNLTRPTE